MTAPAHLSAAAVKVWDELVADLGELPVNRPAFEAYCVQVARLRDAQGRVDREGLVVADEKGRPVPHPAIVIEKAAQAEIRAWAPQIKPPPARRRR